MKLLSHLLSSGLIKSAEKTIDLNKNSNNLNVIKACLIAAWYPNILKQDISGFLNK